MAIWMIVFPCIVSAQGADTDALVASYTETPSAPDSSTVHDRPEAAPEDHYLKLLMAMPEERFLVRLHNGKKYKGKIVAVRDSIVTIDLEKSKSNQQEQAPTLGFLLDDIESIKIAPKRNTGLYLGLPFFMVAFFFVMSRANK